MMRPGCGAKVVKSGRPSGERPVTSSPGDRPRVRLTNGLFAFAAAEFAADSSALYSQSADTLLRTAVNRTLRDFQAFQDFHERYR